MVVTRETADGEQNRLVDERADRAADDQGGRDEREALRVRDEQEEQLDLLWHSWRSERNSASADDKGKTKYFERINYFVCPIAEQTFTLA